MLSERSRNTAVGLTMFLALVGLMIGILQLGGGSLLARARSYTVTVQSPNAYGLAGGNKVTFNGIQIGHVSTVNLAPQQQGVVIALAIDPGVDIPDNAVVAVLPPVTVGASSINFALPTRPGSSSQYVSPGPPLPKDGTALVQSAAADNGLIPRTVIEQLSRVGDKVALVGDKVSLVSNDLHELLEKRNLTEFEKQNPDARTANISILVQRLDRVARAVDTLVGDPETQQRFRQIVGNLQESSVQLKTLLAHADAAVGKADGAVGEFAAAGKTINAAATQAVETLAASREQILKTADRLATLLGSLEKTTTALAEGKGTAGKMVHDPRLYDALLDLSRSLKSTADDMNLLLRQWQKEGVNLQLK